MPFTKAAAATGCCRVLRNEHRMAPHGGLLAVIVRPCWRQARGDEVRGVLKHYLQALMLKIGSFTAAKTEALPKG